MLPRWLDLVFTEIEITANHLCNMLSILYQILIEACEAITLAFEHRQRQ